MFWGDVLHFIISGGRSRNEAALSQYLRQIIGSVHIHDARVDSIIAFVPSLYSQQAGWTRRRPDSESMSNGF